MYFRPPLGESVSKEDQQTGIKDALSSSSSTANLLDPVAPPVTTGAVSTDADRARWEEEKQKLYQQLDDKVRGQISGFLDQSKMKFLRIPLKCFKNSLKPPSSSGSSCVLLQEFFQFSLASLIGGTVAKGGGSPMSISQNSK